jgi:nucleoside-diphosphate-sugar epimerase
MVNKHILVTGANGFLGKNLCTLLKNNHIHKYTHDVRNDITVPLPARIDIVMHLASPSDYCDFEDTNKTTTTIIDGTVNMLNLARKYNSKFVFASSMAVERPKDINDIYGNCKLAMENYIEHTYNNYMILRIPRVYDKTRDKGLMKRIRDNIIPREDYGTVVEFITLSQFLDQTLSALHHATDTCDGVIKYTGVLRKTIQEIADMYK